MKFSERFKRLKDATGLSLVQMAEIFGVEDIQTVRAWYIGKAEMQKEFQATLLRLESDALPALSPQLRPETVRAFYAGRNRARVVNAGKNVTD